MRIYDYVYYLILIDIVRDLVTEIAELLTVMEFINQIFILYKQQSECVTVVS
jgi:hypothetical protein